MPGKQLRARASGAAHRAAKPGAWLALMFVGRQIDFIALRGPDRNDCFIAGALAHFRDEPCRDVVTFQFRRRGVHVVIDCPTALQVAAAAGTGSGLEIVQQQAAPAGRGAL